MSARLVATSANMSALKKRRQTRRMKKRVADAGSSSTLLHLTTSPNNSMSSRSEEEDRTEEQRFFGLDYKLSVKSASASEGGDSVASADHLRRKAYIKLNIGGSPFRFDIVKMMEAKMETSRLFQFARYSHLMRLSICKDYIESSDEYFFERSAALFRPIYIFYLTGEIIKPTVPCDKLFREELEYWGMSDHFHPRCCKRHNMPAERQEPQQRICAHKEDPFQGIRWGEVRKTVWQLLQKPSSSNWAKLFSLVMLLTLFVSNLALMLGSMEQFQVANGAGDMQPHMAIELVEAGCVAIFTAEYVIKMVVHPHRSKIAKQPLNIIDLLAVLPFFIETVLNHWSVVSRAFKNVKSAMLVVRVVRVLRVMRLLKLGRYSRGMRVMAKTVKNARAILLMTVTIVLLSIVFCATLIYFVEKDVEGTDFTSIPQSMWWSLVTVTTVGYGDAVPKTTEGKIVASFTIAWGIVALALPITAVMQTFMEMQEAMEEGEDTA